MVLTDLCNERLRSFYSVTFCRSYFVLYDRGQNFGAEFGDPKEMFGLAMMRKLRFILILAGLSIGMPAGAVEPPVIAGDFGRKIEVLDPAADAPEVAFKDGSGRDWGFVEFKGKVVVAIFWATWCPICAKEMPKLDQLQAELGPEGLKVIALSVDDAGPSVVVPYYAQRGIRNLNVYHDAGSLLAAIMGIRGVPTVFVIDADGRLVGAVEGGADWGSAEAKAYLRHYLADARS